MSLWCWARCRSAPAAPPPPDFPGAEPYHPTLLADAHFRIKWQSADLTLTLTATLATEAWVKGLALCQLGQAAVLDFVVFVYHSGSALPHVFSGPNLDAITVREGLVLKVLFDEPMRTKRVQLDVRSATAPPRASRLMVMTWTPARARALEVAGDGKLWICNLDGGVLTTVQGLDEEVISLGIDTSGGGHSVRKGLTKPWVIGANDMLWRGEPNGWVQVAGSPTLARIAVDVGDESVWTVAATDGRVRRLHGGRWSDVLGEHRALDLCVHNGRAWMVEKESRAVFAHRGGGWTRLSGSSPFLNRVAVDEVGGTLWALAIDGRIFHRAAGTENWTEHAGGKVKEITVHRGTPYVIGMDDGLWKSVGANGWVPLPVLMSRP